LAALFLLATFLAGLRFAAALRAGALRAADLRAADLRADLRAVVFFLRAEALVAFGLRDAAARFLLGFLDFAAFAMIDLPVLWQRFSTPCYCVHDLNQYF
jgi:hypothetical protein